MREITFFVGGSVGSDPYAANTWSGISPYLLKAMGKADLLDKAVGLKLPRIKDVSFRAKNFNSSRAVWRKQYYFDPAYRRALTKKASAVPVQSPVCLQAGSMFSLPAAFPDRLCVSYHDGNLAQLVDSGFGLDGIPRKRIDQALRYEEEVAHQADGVFTFSEYLRESFIRDFRVSPDKVFKVGGAINLSDVPDENPHKDYGLQKILFIGIDAARKGCALLLEAFGEVRQRYPKAELHIVGPSELGPVPDGVVFHGRLSKGDPIQKAKLDALFADSTLFVLPSLYEPFGIAPLEAMIHEIPCVLTDAWAFREFITPGFNGELVQKGSVEDLTAKISYMLDDPARLARMGRRSRKLVLENYTWDAVANRMRDAIESLQSGLGPELSNALQTDADSPAQFCAAQSQLVGSLTV